MASKSLFGRAKQIEGDSEEARRERIAEFKKNHAVFFWKPYPWQVRSLAVIHAKNVCAPIASNKIGKSAFGACVVISWALGFEPWDLREEGDPEAVCFQGQWYKRSSLGIAPPVNIIITGEDWKLHLGRVIVPELKKWAPINFYQTKKNEQGVEFYWEWITKSTFTLMSYTQEDDLFESFRAQGAWEDEPPPKSKHTALSRGLLLDNGKTLMTLTPLKEAWILDDIVLSGRKDIGVVDNLMITDNPDLYNSDKAVLVGMGLTDEQAGQFFDLLLYEDKAAGRPVTDKGHAAEMFLERTVDESLHENISKLKILKFIKDIDPADVPPRVFGQFKSLVGRVLKQFDYTVHAVKPFKVPTDWPVTVMIDFHLSTPQAISYWAVNKQDIHYCVKETWQNLSAAEIADDIIRKKLAVFRIENAFIDPLSKGDTAYVRNMLGSDIKDAFSTIYDKLGEHGITLRVASKDKDSGVKNVQEWLRGPNGLPTCYVFNDCDRHLFEVQRWVFDEHGKPIKENDHFMENWYRYSLTGAKYEDSHIKPLVSHRVAAGAGSWMGA